MAALALCSVAHADDSSASVFAFGAGVQRFPAYAGASSQRNEAVPYVNIEYQGFDLSTLDGLQWDFIRNPGLSGGIYGNYRWGRDTGDLPRSLQGRLNPLSPRLHVGGFLEWQINKPLDVGANLSHDTDGAGAYLNVYTDYTLPNIWYLQHSVTINVEALNGAGMRRYYGISPREASRLDIQPWHPGAGGENASLEYDLFVPTSLHTGVALAVNYARLYGGAGNSPLVTQFGSRSQWTESMAFLYHF